MQHQNPSAIERNDPMPEIAGLLALGYRRRRRDRIKAALPENSLDDDRSSGKANTTVEPAETRRKRGGRQ